MRERPARAGHVRHVQLVRRSRSDCAGAGAVMKIRMRILGVLLLALSACIITQHRGGGMSGRPNAIAELRAATIPSNATAVRPAWIYRVTVPAEAAPAIEVEVDAVFRSVTTNRFVIEAPSAAAHVSDLRVLRDDSGRTTFADQPLNTGDEPWWIIDECHTECHVHYRLDLTGLAEDPKCRDQLSCAQSVGGGAVLASSRSWLLRPASHAADVPVTVTMTTNGTTTATSGDGIILDESSTTFLSGMKSSFRSPDLDEGAFTAFGRMRRMSILVDGAEPASRLEVAVLGTSYRITDSEFRAWIADTASSLRHVYGRFPVERATVFIVPRRAASDVVFGKVLSLSGASVAIVVGERMPPSALKRDWVLRHELFHLGFPSFRGEGRWLIEGLAVYYELLLRARGGISSDAAVLGSLRTELAGDKSRLDASSSLAARANRDDLESIYWGGAAFCLAADVRIRSETHGERSLDDVLRALLDRGGDATRVWALNDVLDLGDRVTGTSTMTELYRRHAIGSERVDVTSLFRALGVMTNGENPAPGASITLDDEQPLAWLRRDMTRPRSFVSPASKERQ